MDNLTENLMRILIKLDGIEAEGDLKLQRREQVELDVNDNSIFT